MPASGGPVPGSILGGLGFQTDIKGDLIEAVLKGHDATSLREKLDQMGRLLASSRLLDITSVETTLRR